MTLYQTDRAAERRLAARVAKACGFAHMHEFPRLFVADFGAVNTDGALGSLWEFKIRTCRSNAYDSLMFDAAKAFELLKLGHALAVPAYIAAEYADGVARFANVAAVFPTVASMGGRTDRGDPLDVEPVVYIPARVFRVIP